MIIERNYEKHREFLHPTEFDFLKGPQRQMGGIHTDYPSKSSFNGMGETPQEKDPDSSLG